MDKFVETNEELNVGAVMNFIGTDPSVVNKVAQGIQSGKFEIVSHGWNHVDYTGLTRQQQQSTLQMANEKMVQLWSTSAKTFIPPYNVYNDQTLTALHNLGMEAVSGEFDQELPSIYDPDDPHSPSNKVYRAIPDSNIVDSHGIYHLPQVVGFYTYDSEPPTKTPMATLVSDIDDAISFYGYAVVTLHPQDFVTKDENNEPIEGPPSAADPAEIADLGTLINTIHTNGYSIKHYSEAIHMDNTPPTVLNSPAADTYTSGQSVTLTANEPATTIYYTVDGSTPTTGSPVYSAPIAIANTTTLKFFGRDTAGNSGPVTTAVYVISTGGSFPITQMADNTQTFGLSGQQAHVEFVSPTSQLVGKSIDQITLKLRKTGAPAGTIEVGIFNPDLTTKKLFGTMTTSNITSAYTDYAFSLANSNLYLVQSGDRIGIKYTGGDSANFVAVMLDKDAADPFDGTNTYRQQYGTPSWTSSLSDDMYMTLRQTHA